MTAAFQSIFEKQANLNKTTQDTKPLEELNNCKITPDKAQQMEGL
jgi:hypothetical protein